MIKKWLICTTDQKGPAEEKIFATFLRYVISKRNGVTAWNTVAGRDFDITELVDSELTPGNGFPIMYRNQGQVKKDGAFTTQILDFREMTNGQWASSFNDTHFQVDIDGEGNKTRSEVPTASFLDFVDFIDWTETRPELKEI